jgi:hypothetical protein
MHWIYHDHFKVFVYGVLVDPVTVEEAEGWACLTGSAFGHSSFVFMKFQARDTRGLGFSKIDTLVKWAFPASAANGNSVYHESLFSLITKHAGFSWTTWALKSDNAFHLSHLPTTDPEQKSHDITLFLVPDVPNIAVATH